MYGNCTSVRLLDKLADDARVGEINRERDLSGCGTWIYTALLFPGWSNEHGEHFVEADTASALMEEFARVIRPCECAECKGGNHGN